MSNSDTPVSIGVNAILGRVTQTTRPGIYTTCGQRQQVCRYNRGFGALVPGNPGSELSFPGTPEGRWTSADVPIQYSTNLCGTAYINAQCYQFDPANCPSLGGQPAGCIDHNTSDCQCFNRQASTAYQTAKGLGLSFAPDACWYVPCANPTIQLIPLEVTAGVPVCKNIQVCSQITQIIAGGNVNFNPNLQSIINCSFDNPSNPTNPDNPNNPSNPTNPPPSNPTDTNKWWENKVVLYIGIALALLLILLLVYYFVYK